MRRFWSSAYLLLSLTALMWGGNAIASRLAIGEISPMVLTFIRWVGVCAVLPVLYGRDIAAHASTLRAHWKTIVTLALLGFTAFNALMYVAAHSTTAINIGIIQGAIPVFVLLGARLLFGTAVTPMQALGVGVTMAGVIVIATKGDLGVLKTLAFNSGDVLMLVAGVFYAIYTLALRNRPPLPPMVFFTALALAACFWSLGLVTWEIRNGTAIWPGAKGWAILAFVTLGPSLFAQLFFMRGVELIGPGRAGIFVNLVPVFAAILAVLILGEIFAWYHAAALALVLGGIALAEMGKPPGTK
ncbi:MAG: DMT family transporter [Beijerinckiaceae bacterium]